MERRMIRNVVSQDEVRQRDRLFRTAKKSLNKVSKTPSNEEALDTLLETLQEIAAKLKGRANEVDERDEDDVEEIENEDDEGERRAPDEKEVVKAMKRNSGIGADAVQRALARDPRYAKASSRYVENRDERRRSSIPIINAMNEYRDNQSADAVVRELRRKGR